MSNLQCSILVLLSLVSTGLSLELCGNGVFKCTSPSTLKICFNGHLVGSEFLCPNSTVCCETSESICSAIPDPSCHDYEYESNSIELDILIPDIKAKPELDKPGTGNSVCQAQGKFPSFNTNCKKYIMCIKSPTGFREKEMTCYGEKLFDPVSGLCSDTFECAEPTQSTPAPFCQEQGKYPVLDTGCKNYIMCTKTTTGFREKPMSCYGEKLFDPATGLCSDTYMCPEPMPSTPAPFCQEQGKYPVLDTGCKNYIMCTKTTTGFREKPMSCYGEKLFDPETGLCSDTYICPEPTPSTPAPFCQEQGKFPMPNSKCTKYINCIKATTGFREKEMSCYGGKLFDPIIGLCSDSYICDEFITSTTEVIPNKSNSTDDCINTESTTTFHPTVTVPVPQLPFCDKMGKFAIPNTECTQYLYCVKTSTGFQGKVYNCPMNSYFNPSTSNCATAYICPEIITTTINPSHITEDTTSSSTTTSENTTPSLTSTPDFIFTPSSTISPEISTTTDLITPEATTTSDIGTTPGRTPTPDLTTASDKTTTINSTPIPTCQVQGKHAISGTKCTKYLMCLTTTTGFWSMQYTCPNGSLFDPDKKLCTVNYQCSETEPAKPTDATSTSTATVSTTTNNATTEIPFCEMQGIFPVSNSNCKKYLLCIITVEGLWGRIYDCLPNTSYDPVLSQCTKTYECEDSIPTTTEVAKPTEIPECIDQGRIYVPDTGCKQFVLCSLTRSGFKSQVYSCPPATYFNSEDGRCYSDFNCPELKSETQNTDVTICATVGRFPDPQDNNCEYYYTCTEVSPNSIEGVKQKCNSGYYFDAKTQVCSKNYVCEHKLDMKKSVMKVISPKLLKFDRCTTIGRWEVSGSKCKNYVLCTANTDGTLKATKFTCPTTTVFNQAIQKCTAQYTCPDNICFMPGLIPNPNDKDCNSYICCDSTIDNIGNVINTGYVKYCPTGCKFNPVTGGCDPTYVCPK